MTLAPMTVLQLALLALALEFVAFVLAYVFTDWRRRRRRLKGGK